MKKFRNKISLDLEVVATMIGFVIIVLTVMALWDYMSAKRIMLTAFAVGSILNGILAGMNWYQRHIALGVLFTFLTLLYFGIFIGTVLTM